MVMAISFATASRAWAVPSAALGGCGFGGIDGVQLLVTNSLAVLCSQTVRLQN